MFCHSNGWSQLLSLTNKITAPKHSLEGRRGFSIKCLICTAAYEAAITKQSLILNLYSSALDQNKRLLLDIIDKIKASILYHNNQLNGQWIVIGWPFRIQSNLRPGFSWLFFNSISCFFCPHLRKCYLDLLFLDPLTLTKGIVQWQSSVIDGTLPCVVWSRPHSYRSRPDSYRIRLLIGLNKSSWVWLNEHLPARASPLEVIAQSS